MDAARPAPLPQTVRPSTTLARLPAANTIEQTARSFETVFLSQAVDQMLSTVEVGTFGGGHAEETWRSFLATAVAESISAQGGTGIAKQIVDAYNRASAPSSGEVPGK